MKARLACALFAIAALPISGSAQESTTERLRESAARAAEATKDTVKWGVKALGESTRKAWKKGKEYLSDDPETYKRGADQKLKELGAEIAELRTNSTGLKERTYFLTRIEALELQHKFAANQLAALPAEEVKKGREGERSRVDTVIGHLEDYVDLAKQELREFDAVR